MHGTDVDPRELALQIVDIVALRPEVELCYMGIANKCFEVLENRRSSDSWDGRPESRLGINAGNLDDDEPAAGSDGEEDEDEDDVPEEAVEEEADQPDEAEADTESDEDDADDEDTDSEAESSEGGRGTARLRLREILFYDDKVAIFKARHGRL